MTHLTTLSITGAALLATALVVRPASAQEWMSPAIDLSVGSDDPSSSDALGPALRIAPSMLVDRARGVGMLRTELDVGERAVRLHVLDASASLVTPRLAGLRTELHANARHDGTRPDLPVSAIAAQARLHAASATEGAWIGAGAERVWASRIGRSTPIVTVGGWMRRRGLTLNADVTYARLPELLRSGGGGFPDSLISSASRALPLATLAETASVAPPPLENTDQKASSWEGRRVSSTEAHVGVQWGVGRLQLGGLGGAWLGGTTGPRSWASASATFWLTSRFALIASGGRRPLGPMTGGVSSRFAMLGVRLARWSLPARAAPRIARAAATRFHVTRLAGRTLVEVRAAGATRVELQGDATQWSAVRLTRAGEDRWTAELRLRPGIYHVALRVDGGAWTPPPGLPTMEDGYGGLIGILIVE